MSDHPVPADRQVAPCRHAVRVLAVLICVVVPTLAILLLTGVWMRSIWVDEYVEIGRYMTTLEPGANGVTKGQRQLTIETARGVIGVTLSAHSMAFSQLPPSIFDSFAERRKKEDGWRYSYRRTAKLSTPTVPYRPFNRDRQTVGWAQTLQWGFSKSKHEGTMVGGFVDGMSGQLVAPCWAWMLPMVVPPLWWLWCPPGWAFPRMTLRRAMAATAILAMILGATAALYRSARMDRTLMALEEFHASWDYGPDPTGSGRPVITKISFFSDEPDYVVPDQERLVAVLRSFPVLEALVFRTSQKPVIANTFTHLVEDHPGLTEVVVPRVADDQSMAAIGRLRHLRKLELNGSKITGAGLAHLAGHPALEDLSLDKSQMSEAGLDALHGLPRLKSMSWEEPTKFGSTVVGLYGILRRDQVQGIDAAIRRLAESLPSLER